jgi:hypothetical protein
MMEVFNAGFLVAICLIIWFKSNAFVQYVKLFRLGKIFQLPLYERQKEDDPLLTYIQFLRKEFNGFFISLITCPLCFSIWISIIIALLFNILILWPTINVIGLFTYYLYSKLWT